MLSSSCIIALLDSLASLDDQFFSQELPLHMFPRNTDEPSHPHSIAPFYYIACTSSHRSYATRPLLGSVVSIGVRKWTRTPSFTLTVPLSSVTQIIAGLPQMHIVHKSSFYLSFLYVPQIHPSLPTAPRQTLQYFHGTSGQKIPNTPGSQ